MKGIKALQQAEIGFVIKIAHQPGRLNLVWRDKKSGLKRIGRPKMLVNTFSAEEKAWEILNGRAANISEFTTIADGYGLATCRHCIKWSSL